MNQDLATIVHAVVQRAPQWLRHDLASKDEAERVRAEEAMVAMIVNALAKTQSA